ncbi:SAC3/GANP/Nin1/mts3/eIF-3 p25 family-domain-containing protein [Cladorrhinum samala]|uniref:SAC3/GANP/Nin1/mts3/eIF-3 p25 family-domain-containing protein n=1 Tax=Cladorrhinum samala TaxID=585594 RepID=A0AAV9HPR8_9PEZI|nr:SAC3/GANP/Nin1/mts3/eIF-3 p25 family-domain-containing protein [Cladorrhinum samala]
MGSPANNPFGVPEQVSKNQFLAPSHNNPFGAPPPANPFGAPTSTSRSTSPFGAPPAQSSGFGTPFGSTAQSRIPSPNPASSNPFIKPAAAPSPLGAFSATTTNTTTTTSSPFGAQPAGGFGAQSAFGGSATGNEMAGGKRARSDKGPAKSTGTEKKARVQSSNDGFGKTTPSGFGSQGDPGGTKRVNVFGKNMDKSLFKIQPKPRPNERTTTTSGTGRNAPAGSPMERTRELSQFAFDFANKLNDHLKKEKLSAPSMPPEPGNPKKRAAIESTKDAFRKYRTRVYASLRKVEYIDDPEKRRRLQDALPFKGICEDMCPEFERVARIAEYDVKTEEKKQGADGSMWPEPSKMVKKFGRSAAGQDAPLPMDVRSVAALGRTVDYLFKDLLQSENNLPSMHNFLWDRTRAVRKDFTFHSSKSREEMKVMVHVFETITRFHATALHLLSRKGFANEDFDQKQEIEQLGRTLLSLMEAYNVCKELGVVCPNEPEFRAYYLLLNAHDPSIPKRILTWGKETWFQSPEVQTALSLITVMDDIRETKGPLKPRRPPTLAGTAFRTFFSIVEHPRVSYTMACVAEVHFTYVRQNILKNFVKGYARHRDAPRTITASDLNKVMRFDTDEEAVEFVELHDFEFSTWVPPGKNPVSEPYLLLNNKKRGVPSPRVRQAYSGKLVERKRTTESIVDAIYTTIYEKSDGQTTQMVEDDSDSLFVPQTVPVPPAPSFSAPTFAPPAFGGNAGNTAFGNGFGVQQPAAAPPSSVFSGFQNSQPAAPAASNFFTGFNQPATAAPAAPPPAPGSFGVFGQPAAPNPATTAPSTTGSTSSVFGQTAKPPTAPASAAPGIFSGFGNQGAAPAPSTITSTPPAFSFGQPAAVAAAAKSPFPSIPPQQIAPTTKTSNPLPAFGQPAETKPPENVLSQQKPFPSLDKAISSPQTPSFPPTGQQPLPSFGGFAPAPPTSAPSSVPAAQPSSSSSSSLVSGLGVAPSASAFAPPSQTIQPETPSATTQPASAQAAASSAPSVFVSQPSPAITAPPALAYPITPVKAASQPAPPSTPFQFPGQAPAPAAPSFQQSTFQQSAFPLAPAPPPSPPKRDLLGDFTQWFVLGDDGLMEQFTENAIQNLLWEVYSAYENHKEQAKRQAEDDESWRIAREHMTHRLSVKYFYRWRESARVLAQRRILREGKQKMREYREQQRMQKKLEEEERLKAEADARRAARRKAEADRLQLSLIAKATGRGRRNSIAFSVDDGSNMNAEEQLLRSGIFAGLGRDERGLVRRAVNGEDNNNWADVSASKSYYRYPESDLELEQAPGPGNNRDFSPSSSVGRREGWKTRSLREKFGIEPRRSVSASGSDRNGGGFRASLPLNRSTNFSAVTPASGRRSIAGSSDGGDPEAKRKSYMSVTSVPASATSMISKSRHWDLRARGFVPMPDGNWLPEAVVRTRGGENEYQQHQVPDDPDSLQSRLARLKQDSAAPTARMYAHSARGSLDLDRGRSRYAGSVTGGMSPPPPPLWKDSNVVVNKRKREGGNDVEMLDREISPPEKKVFTATGPGAGAGAGSTSEMVANTQRMLRELRETMDRLDQDNRDFYQEQQQQQRQGMV